MLSFQQKTHTTFRASVNETVPTDVHRNPTRSCTIEAPGVQPHTLSSVARREKYLADLASNYVCRWKIVTEECDDAGDANDSVVVDSDGCIVSAVNFEDLSRAFYATLPLPFERRENMSDYILSNEQLLARNELARNNKEAQAAAAIATGEETKNEATKQTVASEDSVPPATTTRATTEAMSTTKIDPVVVDAGTRCWQCTAVHDWSQDALKTDQLDMKSRKHLLCKYTHPCNDGKVCVPMQEATPICASANGANLASASKMVPTATKGGYGYMAELHAYLEKRVKQVDAASSSEKQSKVVQKVEKHRAQRRREQRRERELEQEEAASVRKETDAVCARMIERMRARTSGRDVAQKYVRNVAQRPKSLIVDDDNDSSDVTGTESSDESSAASELVGQASSSESATFSDECHYDHVEGDETASSDHTSETNDDDDSNSISNQDEKDTEKKGEEGDEIAVNKMVRQTNVEVMIPICEPEDTFSFFQKLDCPYIMQWADKDRTRLHIYRRHKVVSRLFVFGATVETSFQLIVTISIV